MCGRFSIGVDMEDLGRRFRVALPGQPLNRRYNVAPGQEVPVILNTAPDRFSISTWGFQAPWKPKPGARPFEVINARAETAAEKPMFHAAFKDHRCLIPADGFYEWSKPGRVPYRITRKDEQPFAFAGLWQERESGTGFSILTVDANKVVAPIHDRMPVMLDEEAFARWLDLDTPPEMLSQLLLPYPSDRTRAYRISTLVNKPANDNPKILDPIRK